VGNFLTFRLCELGNVPYVSYFQGQKKLLNAPKHDFDSLFE